MATAPIRLHDSLTGGVRELVPREPGKVGIYACGPTVYGRIHVGNARPYVVFALLKRCPKTAFSGLFQHFLKIFELHVAI
jgi:cysteinyl-tRNA synthetase